MGRIIFIILSLFIFIPPGIVLAQEQEIESIQIGIQTAGQLLKDISVTHFEDADTWTSGVPIDRGVVISMKRKGKPLEIPEVDASDNVKNEYVLGVKVFFNQRGYANIAIRPPKPIKIPGITKALTLWVAGRSFKHRLFVHILDITGNEMVLDMGLLDFVGWKKVTVNIPSKIQQDDYHSLEWRGLSFAGLSIQSDPMESFGVYYVYFDELRAITDMYNEERADLDDIQDEW